MSTKPTGAGALLPSATIAAAAAIWGLYWVPLRAVEAMDVEGVWAVLAFNLPALALAGVVLALRPGACRGRWGGVAAAGALAGAGLGLYAAGLVYTSVIRATMLFYLTPVWGTLLGMALLGERPGPRRWMALALALVGLGLILGMTPDDLSLDLGPGEVLGGLSGLAWAGSAVVMRQMRDAPIVGVAFMQYASLVVVVAAIALAMSAEAPPLTQMAAAGLSWTAGPSVAILLSLYAIFWAMGRVSPGRSGLLMMTEAIIAVISATIFLPEEAMSAIEWLGAALIIAAGLVEVSSADA